jgi:hypothetical protein
MHPSHGLTEVSTGFEVAGLNGAVGCHACGMWNELGRVARRQAGVVSLGQALTCGISGHQLRRRAASDGWQRLTARTWLLPGSSLTPAARAWSAVLTVTSASRHHLPGAAITGRAALWLRGLVPGPPELVEVVVPHGRRVPRASGITVMRSRTLRDDDVRPFNDLPVTVVGRACLDIARRERQPEPIRGLLIDLRQRRVDLRPIARRALDAMPSPGLAGYLEVLDELAGNDVDSVFARKVQRWLADHGIVTVAEHPILTPTGTVHADLAVVDARVSIECDGFGSHSTRTQLDVDARRSNGLALCPGWIVLRITWDRFHTDRAGFLAELHQALALRAA